MPVIIHVEHLSKHYKDIKAVDDISFTVNQGEIYGFLGQNGAGKSTTIRMLLTLVEPTKGRIQLFGSDLRTHRKEILRQVGAIIEKPDLYKYLTALENLSIFARLSGIRASQKQLLNQLEMVGLKNRVHSKIKTYSQGMKQRLGIAVALIHDPKLIILDEPTNGLDPQGIADIRNLILQLSKEQGKTIFVSSHLLSEIEMIADKMLILDQGKKIVEGAVGELLDPTKTLVELEVNNPDDIYEKIKSGSWNVYLKERQKQTIIFQLAKEKIPQLNAYLISIGAEVMALQPRHSLENYFLSLTTSNQHVDSFAN
ncbi:MAG: ABC transporter ATP-binding protein [Chitinophagaceae bacterium]|nr:ABC transporter ATP-binding protein [Chitinophagaceae bacterium]